MNNFFMISMMILILIISSNNFKEESNKMIMIIIISTILISCQISMFSKNSWVGINLFLLMVGGLMILFSLVISVLPKMKSNSLKMMNMLILIPILIFQTLKNSENFNNFVFPFNFMMNMMTMILIMIIFLNLILTIISKMIIMPMKPYRMV